HHLNVTGTLPAGADDEGGVDAVRGVQRPVVDDLRALAVGRAVGLSVHEQLHVREAHVHGVVVPLAVAHLPTAFVTLPHL
ncbi:jg12265, partial [Pararge aegeria aegeria]